MCAIEEIKCVWNWICEWSVGGTTGRGTSYMNIAHQKAIDHTTDR